MTTERPSIDVAVVMRKERVQGAASRWQTWRWVLSEVLSAGLAGADAKPGAPPRRLYRNDAGEAWLHPGFQVALFADDAEGYYLNVTTPQPCWFVLWRMEHEAQVDAEPIALPQIVTLSYHDAGRWLDAQETVEQVPAPDGVVQWLQAFVDEHHVVTPKRRQRPQSFRPLTDRFGNPAAVSVGKASAGQGSNGQQDGPGGSDP